MRILVNCALPYANNPLHLGHIAGAYLGADIFVRYRRLIGDEVMFISGSDQYGTPITIQADAEGISPADLARRFHIEHKKAFEGLNIKFDIFSETMRKEHHDNVKEVFLELLKKGYLYEKVMNSPFCPTCNRFMPDRYIKGICPHCGYDEARGDQCENCGKVLDPKDLISPRCAICGDSPEFRDTKHFFFRLSSFQDNLINWLKGKEYWRKNVLEFTRNFVEAGLEDRPITRDIEWGVEVPVEGYEHKKIYVWFEALLGYISAARIYSSQQNDPERWKKYWQDGNARVYCFIGKDNIPFHTVIFPAMLMALERFNLPYDVPANEFLNFSGKKFSKSKGVGFTVSEVLTKINGDYIRYYLSSIMPETGDSDFSIEDLREKVNSELIGKYGNLAFRSTSFILKNSLVPRPGHDDEYPAVLDFLREKLALYRGYLDGIEIKKALHEWLEVVQFGNVYMNRSAPWKLIKTDSDSCSSKLYTVLRIIHYATVMAYPFIPSSAERIWKMIGMKTPLESSFHTLSEEPSYAPIKTDPPFSPVELSSVNPNSLDLRVARIVDVQEHPNADRLYVLKLSLGTEERQLVAGLRNHYSREELIGRKIIIVYNLKPAKIRGMVSNGMLLAADNGKDVRFLTVGDHAKEGDRVRIGDYDYNNHGRIEIRDLEAYRLHISTIDGKPVATASVDDETLVLNCRGESVFPERNIEENSRIR